MKKLEMIIRPEMLEELKSVLEDAGIRGMTVTMVSGCGNQKGRKEIYRGTQINVNLLPKIRVESVVSDSDVDGLIPKIREALATGNVGDGKIFVYPVEQAIRIRTGESGDKAI